MLTSPPSGINVYSALAKSKARIGIRQYFKAHNRHKRFFCATASLYLFMAELLGLSSDRPVSLKAGYANPNKSATIPDTSITGGSTEGALSMATSANCSPFPAGEDLPCI